MRIVPESVAYTYRALQIVQKFGPSGGSIAKYAIAVFGREGRAYNRVGSQVLTSLERRGLVMAIGEDPAVAPSEWHTRIRSNRRTYVISEAGEAYLKAQVEAAAARARELARVSAPPSAEDSPQKRDGNAVGGWDP